MAERVKKRHMLKSSLAVFDRCLTVCGLLVIFDDSIVKDWKDVTCGNCLSIRKKVGVKGKDE